MVMFKDEMRNLSLLRLPANLKEITQKKASLNTQERPQKLQKLKNLEQDCKPRIAQNQCIQFNHLNTSAYLQQQTIGQNNSLCRMRRRFLAKQLRKTYLKRSSAETVCTEEYHLDQRTVISLLSDLILSKKILAFTRHLKKQDKPRWTSFLKV
jgi:hypothetical protein